MYHFKNHRVEDRWNYIEKANNINLNELSHKGDPCYQCGTPHDEVKQGPCPKYKYCNVPMWINGGPSGLCGDLSVGINNWGQVACKGHMWRD